MHADPAPDTVLYAPRVCCILSCMQNLKYIVCQTVLTDAPQISVPEPGRKRKLPGAQKLQSTAAPLALCSSICTCTGQLASTPD